MVEWNIGRKEGNEGSIQSCGINRLGGGAQILAHGSGGFPTVPEIPEPFSGKSEGPLGPSHPCGHGEAGVHEAQL